MIQLGRRRTYPLLPNYATAVYDVADRIYACLGREMQGDVNRALKFGFYATTEGTHAALYEVKYGAGAGLACEHWSHRR